MKTIRHYADVPEAYAIRTPELTVDAGPEKTPEAKRAELKAAAAKQLPGLKEQP